MAYFFFQRFGLSEPAIAVLFVAARALNALSHLGAAWLADRIGLVNTMVFTHIPSSVCLILAAVAPSLELALAFLLVRAALSQMDVPTRSSYVMAVVTPPERPAAASVTSVPRSLAAAASPALAGALFAAGYEAWPLVICGALKILYDLALLSLVVVHGFNGLRYVLTDYTMSSPLLRRASVYLCIIGAVILLVLGAGALLSTIDSSAIEIARTAAENLYP